MWKNFLVLSRNTGLMKPKPNLSTSPPKPGFWFLFFSISPFSFIRTTFPSIPSGNQLVIFGPSSPSRLTFYPSAKPHAFCLKKSPGTHCPAFSLHAGHGRLLSIPPRVTWMSIIYPTGRGAERASHSCWSMAHSFSFVSSSSPVHLRPRTRNTFCRQLKDTMPVLNIPLQAQAGWCSQPGSLCLSCLSACSLPRPAVPGSPLLGGSPQKPSIPSLTPLLPLGFFIHSHQYLSC